MKKSTASKKIKGSAEFTTDGGFSFTPYATLDVASPRRKKIAEASFSALWLGHEDVHIRMSFSLPNVPPLSAWHEQIDLLYKKLKIRLLENELQ